MTEDITLGRQDSLSGPVEDWIGRHFGLKPADGRFQQVLSAVSHQARQLNCGSLGDYLQRLDREPAHYRLLVEQLSVQESYFFRVAEQFFFIRDRLLPDFAACKERRGMLNAWSAGCANGEEVYSLAILLHEAGWLDRAQILGTDVSEQALNNARRGLYRSWSFRNEGRWPGMRRYFSASADGGQVIDLRLRGRVGFRRQNLLHSARPGGANEMGNQDLILCRNVLIYFNREHARRVLQYLQGCLAPGGWLITGPSDPLAPAVGGCETVVTEAGIFYRRRRDHEPEGSTPGWRQASAFENGAPPSSPQDDAMVARPKGDGRPSCGADSAAPSRVAADEGGEYRAPVAQTVQAIAPWSAGEAGALHEAGLKAAMAGRLDEAVTAFRKALYLDSSLLMVQLNMAVVLERQGRMAEAERLYRQAYHQAAGLPAETPVALVEAMTAGEMRRIAGRQLTRLRQRR